MKVVLVQPNLKKLNDKTSHPHAGLAYIGAVSAKKGFDTFGIDAKYEGINNKEVIERISKINPKIVGFTARTPDIKEAENMAKYIKERNPKTKIVVGGAHVTGLQKRVLEECKYFDVGICGEGEVTFSDVLDHYKYEKIILRDIQGIIYRENSNIAKTEPREKIKDLNTLPYPKWDLFKTSSDLSIFTSRGCPYKCKFCQRVMGNKVRVMSPERVIEEMTYNIDKHKARFFQIEDEVFGLNKKWMYKTLDLMITKGIHKKVKWFANSRVNVADYDMYKKMKEAGCIGVGFGVESGNQNILDNINKGIKLEQVVEAVRKAKKASLGVNAFFILGHPYETKKTIKDTIKFASKLNTDSVSFGIMVPYPGTEIYEMAKKGEGGYISFNENWEQYTKYFGNTIELDELRGKDLQKYQKLAYIEFYLRNLRIKDLFNIFIKYMKNR